MRLQFIALALAAANTGTALSIKARQGRTEQSIDKLIKAKGKEYFGTAADKKRIDVVQNADIIKADFGSITPEDSLKWSSTQPEQGKFSFEGSDYTVKFATDNSKLIRGHALLWATPMSDQLPQWVLDITDPAELTKVIETHIAEVVGRYKGQISQWDVVNEAFNEDGSLRDNHYRKVLGDDYFAIGFKAAAKADPDARLYVTDFNLNTADGAKTKGVVAKVADLKAKGVPIHGIGNQGHILEGQANGVGEALAALAAGVDEVAFTEVAIQDSDPDAWTKVVQACLDEKKCVGVTTWGLRSVDLWRSKEPKWTNALLFDDDYQPQPSYDAIVKLLQS